MRLAKAVGIEVPFHGLVYNVDGSFSYFIKRFDREGKQKIAVEDFSQLSGCTRDTKYESSMEKVAFVIERHCTFPLLEKVKLFRLVVFNFLIGNEDMHLKNFTMIRRENKVELSPVYDLLNTTIVLSAKEEIALPIRGKKSNLSFADFMYFGLERLKLSEAVLQDEFLRFEKVLGSWNTLLSSSFLSEKMRTTYSDLMKSRFHRLFYKN